MYKSKSTLSAGVALVMLSTSAFAADPGTAESLVVENTVASSTTPFAQFPDGVTSDQVQTLFVTGKTPTEVGTSLMTELGFSQEQAMALVTERQNFFIRQGYSVSEIILPTTAAPILTEGDVVNDGGVPGTAQSLGESSPVLTAGMENLGSSASTGTQLSAASTAGIEDPILRRVAEAQRLEANNLKTTIKDVEKATTARSNGGAAE